MAFGKKNHYSFLPEKNIAFLACKLKTDYLVWYSMPSDENIPNENSKEQIPNLEDETVNENILQEPPFIQTEYPGTEQSTTSNTEQQTADMEVHHHPNLHHKPKPWKEYILEFIMIFLAVTLGFFAESYREYLGDQAKETGIVRSLLEDLASDTSVIDTSISQNYRDALSYDTMVNLLRNYKPVDSINHSLYNLYTVTTADAPFIPSERTLIQLKNSGTMHLITNKAVADEIVNYDNYIINLKDFLKIYESYSQQSVNEAEDIFNLSYLKYYAGRDGFDSAANSDTDFVIDPVYRHRPMPLLDTNPKLLAKYANSVWNEQLVVLNYRQLLLDFKKEEIDFIKLLKKEYKIK